MSATEHPDTEAVLHRATGGDRAALAELLELVGPEVRRAIAGRIPAHLRTTVDEDDVMQVTYLEAVLKIDRFVSGGVPGFTAWLTTLASNNLRDALRVLTAAKRPDPRRRVEISGDESALGLVEQLGAVSITPSRVVARDEANRWLDEALPRLPPDYERVIRLYDLEQRPIEEVAESLGRRAGAVYMLRARAHEHLARLLGDGDRFFSFKG